MHEAIGNGVLLLMAALVAFTVMLSIAESWELVPEGFYEINEEVLTLIFVNRIEASGTQGHFFRFSYTAVAALGYYFFWVGILNLLPL